LGMMQGVENSAKDLIENDIIATRIADRDHCHC
jgi:hypothetical protein